jgi:hypothetical protein
MRGLSEDGPFAGPVVVLLDLENLFRLAERVE